MSGSAFPAPYSKPSAEQWQQGLAAEASAGATAGAALAKTYTDAQLVSRDAALTGLSASLGATNATLSALSAAAARNPASADLDMGTHKLTNLAQATNATDAARLDQVTWRLINRTAFSTPQSSVVMSLPTNFTRFRLDLEAVGPAASGFPYVKFSFDDGNTFSGGSSDYAWVLTVTDTSATPTVTYANGSTLLQIGPTGLSSGQSGFVEFCPDDKSFFGEWWGSGNTLTGSELKGRCNVVGTPTHVLFAVSGGNINVGRVRFSGAV
jgi:hypothetical protein